MVRFKWAGWWLGIMLVGASSPAAAQVLLPQPKVELKDYYPNPLGAATTIPFEISPELCVRGHQPVVSLRVFNSLVQVVAIPVLADSSTSGKEDSGPALVLLRLTCGEHRAYWDGKYLDGRREAGTGVYYYQLTVDGERYTRKMIVARRIGSQH
ncbi:MAG TPA: hypothetical protein VFW66_12745 [Gemmatimonadales bacterium]|nr:hypothetical protein [Gemmatimonadales bacterium]